MPIKILTKFIIYFAISFLISCSSGPRPSEEIQSQDPLIDLINELLGQANLDSGNSAAKLRLEAISKLLDAGFITRAEEEAKKLQSNESLSTESKLHLTLLNAKIAIARNQKDTALKILTDSLTISVNIRSQSSIEILLLRGQLYLSQSQPELAIESFVQIIESWPSDTETTLYEDIWSALMLIDKKRLDVIAQSAASYELRGWVELARIVKTEEGSIRTQLNSINQWRRIWAQHSAAVRLPRPLNTLQEIWENRPKHIALMLPIQQSTGNAIQEGFLSEYYQELTNSGDVPTVSLYDTTEINQIYELYNEAVVNGADLIIGPLSKILVNQLQELDKLPVLTLALNYADNEAASENLFQFGLAPEDEISKIINLAWQEGHKNAAILMPDTLDYRDLEEFFRDSWLSKGGEVVSTVNFTGTSDFSEIVRRLMAIDFSESRAEKLLNLIPRRIMEFTPRRRKDIDFIFLVANPRQGRQIKPNLAFYFANNIPVYSMPSIYDGQDNQIGNRDLNGIIFIDAPGILNPTSRLNESIIENLRQTQGSLKRLRAMGIDSFRLYTRLKQFYNDTSISIQGATGTLTVLTDRKIYRDLEVAQFVDGIATPYSPLSSK
ncbi:MAG: penicillin-binding protein activator [Gammaproteobacteria bacterium]|nr:penicillin-binding protein activator [Gammaproteobacteria bacterium]